MAKTTSPEIPSDAQPAAPAPAPRLGDQVMVTAPEGVAHLHNTEAGYAYFVPGEPTPQTVTPLLLRRLADGDLVLL